MSPEREPDYVWAGEPVFQCRTCKDRFERVGNLAEVLQHEAAAHTTTRVSPILGPNGEQIVVVQEG